MPNHIGNSVVVMGPDDEIDRLLATCFRGRSAEEGGGDETHLELDFQTIIPVDDTTIEAVTRFLDVNEFYVRHWGTKWNAYDGMIVERRKGHLNFEFNTAWDIPEPVYRKLGRMFPALAFDIAATDPGAWAITGHVCGDTAIFDENADIRTVYERVYKEPFETAMQPDT